jgi:hypothetical protein
VDRCAILYFKERFEHFCKKLQIYPLAGILIEYKAINFHNLHYTAKLTPWKLRWNKRYVASTGNLGIRSEF